MTRFSRLALAWVLALVLGPHPAQAVILFGTGDPTAHTSPPQGDVANSGWDTQIGPLFSGTAVGPRHVLTAVHLGVGTNSTLTLGALTYPIIDVVDCPDTDLRLLRVGGRFPRWANLHTATNEVGKRAVLFGRGGPRGAAITSERPEGPVLCGWRWTLSDQKLRWGTNVIEGIQPGTDENPGEYLASLFTDDAGDDEATVSVGDSGGGLFLEDDYGNWALGGVLSAVESAFKESPEEAPFYAAVFDRRDFLEEVRKGVWDYDPYRFEQPGTILLASRVSTYAPWIEQELGTSVPVDTIRLLSSTSLDGVFLEQGAYVVDGKAREVRVLAPAGDQAYFQLAGGVPILSHRISGDQLILSY